jgi:hypothetical protein
MTDNFIYGDTPQIVLNALFILVFCSKYQILKLNLVNPRHSEIMVVYESGSQNLLIV